ncbi:IclR family transcriptional regulator [Bacillus sp. B15-48]|uniref:IclR family transcriptional regulator n=1 Tax=Bacillus sp. B15-48 TaxID=1548601 RepID=UPI00193F72E9|nr:IclR family transcriptional regulator [Bacillus sp. B15-48]MBM4762952.1 helix-turn-helix domain-containing protein [Bacillus sp. B15-48]
MKIEKSNTMIQSLQIGISIIDLISSKDTPMRFADIQEETGITKSNLYKYLNTLTQLDLLYRDKQTNLYQLGSKLIQYGMSAIGHNDVTKRVTPFLQEISAYTSCTVLFSVWTHNGPVTAKIWSSNHALNIGAQLGSILPPSSSVGKIFTTFLREGETEEWRGKEGKGHYQLTEQEIANIKKNKISFAKEPLVPSISSTSIPIFDFSEELIGAIAVIGFSETIPSTPSEPISQYLMNFHKTISQIFGYSGKL